MSLALKAFIIAAAFVFVMWICPKINSCIERIDREGEHYRRARHRDDVA